LQNVDLSKSRSSLSHEKYGGLDEGEDAMSKCILLNKQFVCGPFRSCLIKGIISASGFSFAEHLAKMQS